MAQRALLFLCKFSSFRNLYLVFVKPFREVMPLTDGVKSKAAKDVVVGLSMPNSEALMAKFCRGNIQTKTQVNGYINQARWKPCHVHAEIQLVDDFENQREETGWRAHPYIGGSKLCCFLCDSFLRHYGIFHFRGSYWKIYPKWQVPEAFQTGKGVLVFEKSLRFVYREFVEHVRRIRAGEGQPTKYHLRPDSTVDLSTAVIVLAREMAKMSLPSPDSR